MKPSKRYDDTFIPLVARMTTDRFVHSILNNTSIFTAAGLNVNNIDVSTFYVKNTPNNVATVANLIKSINAQSGCEFDIKFIKSLPNNTNYEIAYKGSNGKDFVKDIYKMATLDIYNIIEYCENDIINSIPTLLVADKQGMLYLLYNTCSNKLAKPISDSDKDGFGIVPLSNSILHNIYQNNDTDADMLFTALSKQSKVGYMLYDMDVVSNDIRLYLSKVLDKFEFNTQWSNIIDQYINLPLVDLTNDDNGELVVTKCLIYDALHQTLSIKEATDIQDSDRVVVFKKSHDTVNRVLESTLATNFNIAGESYNIDNVTSTKDITKVGESYSIVANTEYIVGKSDDYEIVGGLRYDASYSEDLNNKRYGYKLLKNKYENTLTDNSKKEALAEMVNFISNKMILAGEGLSSYGINLTSNMIESVIKIAPDKKATIETLADKLVIAYESFKSTGEYDKMNYLKILQNVLNNVYGG